MENKVKPKLRFKSYNDDWEKYSFGEIFNVYQGLQIPIEKRFIKNAENRYFYITIEFLKNNALKYYIEKPSNSVLCNKDDILMTRTGNTGVVVSGVEGCFHNNFFKINYDKTVFDKEYINCLLSTNKIQREILNRAGSSTIPDLGHKSFYKIEGVFPKDKKEQEKIGSLFSNIDKLIETHQEKYEKLKIYKKAMLNKMFPQKGQTVPEIRFNGFSGEWKRDILDNCGKYYTGLSGKTKKDFGHGKGQYITYMNVFSNPIISNKMMDNIEIDNSQNQVKFGDVFFTVSSELPEEVGVSSVLDEELENTYLNSFCFGYRPSCQFNNYFLSYLLKTKSFRSQMFLLAQGVSRYNISKKKVMKLEISIPDIKEQNKIGKFFKDLDELIELSNQKIKKLKNMKSALMNKMFI